MQRNSRGRETAVLFLSIFLAVVLSILISGCDRPTKDSHTTSDVVDTTAVIPVLNTAEWTACPSDVANLYIKKSQTDLTCAHLVSVYRWLQRLQIYTGYSTQAMSGLRVAVSAGDPIDSKFHNTENTIYLYLRGTATGRLDRESLPHMQAIFSHEFGHWVFHQNLNRLISFQAEDVSIILERGPRRPTAPSYFARLNLDYNETFADLVASAVLDNPNIMFEDYEYLWPDNRIARECRTFEWRAQLEWPYYPYCSFTSVRPEMWNAYRRRVARATRATRPTATAAFIRDTARIFLEEGLLRFNAHMQWAKANPQQRLRGETPLNEADADRLKTRIRGM